MHARTCNSKYIRIYIIIIYYYFILKITKTIIASCKNFIKFNQQLKQMHIFIRRYIMKKKIEKEIHILFII
jgi:hypothetical protein